MLLALQGRLPGHPDGGGVHGLHFQLPGWSSRHCEARTRVTGEEERSEETGDGE